MAKKPVEHIEPVISQIPVPQSDSPLVIDLPDGQKLVVGNLPTGAVIEVATWRGTGRPDSRTQRLMLGVSGNEATNVKQAPSESATATATAAAPESSTPQSAPTQSSGKAGKFDAILIPMFKIVLPVVNAFMPQSKQIRIAPSAPKKQQHSAAPAVNTQSVQPELSQSAQSSQVYEAPAEISAPISKRSTKKKSAAVKAMTTPVSEIAAVAAVDAPTSSDLAIDKGRGKKHKFSANLKPSKKNQKNLNVDPNEMVYVDESVAAPSSKFSFKMPKIKVANPVSRKEENVEDWLDRLIAENNLNATSKPNSTSVKVVGSTKPSSSQSKARSTSRSAASPSRSKSVKKKATSTKSTAKSSKSTKSASSSVKKTSKKR